MAEIIVIEYLEGGKVKTREYSKKAHGAKHAQLAKSFVEANQDKGAKIVTKSSGSDEEPASGADSTEPEADQGSETASGKAASTETDETGDEETAPVRGPLKRKSK